MRYDAIVIGAGHNGLVAAARLSLAGMKVLVLESNDGIGGLCMPFEIIPGYTCPGLLPDTTGFRPEVAKSLQLNKHDLQFDQAPMSVLGLGTDSSLLLDRDPGNERERITALSKHDAGSYSKWRAFIERVRLTVRALLDSPPLLLQPARARDIVDIGLQGLSVRRLGRDTMLELLRVIPMSCSDWLGEHFESPLLKQTLAGPALFGSFVGPREAGTAANLLFYSCTSGLPVSGGPQSLIRALRKTCEHHSVTLQTNSKVQRIRVQNGRVQGVQLESGEAVDSEIVLSSCHPVETLLGMIDPVNLSLSLEREIQNYRSRGVIAVLCLALNAPLQFKGPANGRFQFARIGGGSLDYLEKAFDAVKYSRFSSEPYLEVWMPTVSAEGLAPKGHHVASIHVYCAPWNLEGAWNRRRREELYNVVIKVLARHVADLRDRIVGYRLLTPADLEASFSVRGGHLCHGEHALDQMLFMRPSHSTSRYRTRIGGLYLGGSGCHPGGGITGVPGILAAEAILGNR